MYYQITWLSETKQAIEIETLLWNFKVIAIYSLSRPAVSTDEYKVLFQTLGDKFIVSGDWNAEHTHTEEVETHCYKEPLQRATLMRYVEKQLRFYYKLQPTYWPTDTRGFLIS